MVTHSALILLNFVYISVKAASIDIINLLYRIVLSKLRGFGVLGFWGFRV